MLSPVNIDGIQACTVGVSNAASMDNITNNILIVIMSLYSDNIIVASKTKIPVNTSNKTIIFLLFTLSAMIPPKGDNKIVGIVAIDNISANIEADFVFSNTYIESASFSIKLPNNEVACPSIRNIKFLVNNFCVIVFLLLFLKY